MFDLESDVRASLRRNLDPVTVPPGLRERSLRAARRRRAAGAAVAGVALVVLAFGAAAVGTSWRMGALERAPAAPDPMPRDDDPTVPGAQDYDARRTSPVVEVAHGRRGSAAWTLRAYTLRIERDLAAGVPATTDLVCLRWDWRVAGGTTYDLPCEVAGARLPAPGALPGGPGSPPLGAFLVAQGMGIHDGTIARYGIVTDEVERVELDARGTRRLRASVVDAPSVLDADVRFYTVLHDAKLEPGRDGIVLSDARGRLLELYVAR